jgi:hypothetical protein
VSKQGFVARLGESDALSLGSGQIDLAEAKAALADTDRAYCRSVAEMGFAESIDGYVGQESRFYRSGLLPLVGPDVIEASTAVANEAWSTCRSEGILVSRLGDLGFTYGVVEFGKEHVSDPPHRPASYLRIWKKTPPAQWQVMVDVLIPFPAPPGGGDRGH